MTNHPDLVVGRASVGPRWSSRNLAAAVVVIAYVAIQVIVAAIGLMGPRPGRFGWQMYSSAKPSTQWSVQLADGKVMRIDIEGYVAVPRADVRYEEKLPAHLCRVIPNAVEVRVTYDPESRVMRHPCL